MDAIRSDACWLEASSTTSSQQHTCEPGQTLVFVDVIRSHVAFYIRAIQYHAPILSPCALTGPPSSCLAQGGLVTVKTEAYNSTACC
jgi:hypothetical protein